MPNSRTALALSLAAALSACSSSPHSPLDLVGAPDFALETVTFGNRSERVVLPAHCSGPPVKGFGALPPGCASALLGTRDVADRTDLLVPRTAGPGHAAPVERAARRYLFGDPKVPANGGTYAPAGRE